MGTSTWPSSAYLGNLEGDAGDSTEANAAAAPANVRLAQHHRRGLPRPKAVVRLLELTIGRLPSHVFNRLKRLVEAKANP